MRSSTLVHSRYDGADRLTTVPPSRSPPRVVRLALDPRHGEQPPIGQEDDVRLVRTPSPHDRRHPFPLTAVRGAEERRLAVLVPVRGGVEGHSVARAGPPHQPSGRAHLDRRLPVHAVRRGRHECRARLGLREVVVRQPVEPQPPADGRELRVAYVLDRAREPATSSQERASIERRRTIRVAVLAKCQATDAWASQKAPLQWMRSLSRILQPNLRATPRAFPGRPPSSLLLRQPTLRRLTSFEIDLSGRMQPKIATVRYVRFGALGRILDGTSGPEKR